MATKQAIDDFSNIARRIGHAKLNIREVVRQIERIEELSKKMFGDSKRLAEIKKVPDIHPTYTIKQIKSEISNLKTLKEKLK